MTKIHKYILGIAVVGAIAGAGFFIVGSRGSQEANREDCLIIHWRGMSIPAAEFWINLRPVGRGDRGYRQVLKAVQDMPGYQTLVFKPYAEDWVELIERYSRVDYLPFAENIQELHSWGQLLYNRKIGYEIEQFDDLTSLEQQLGD